MKTRHPHITSSLALTIPLILLTLSLGRAGIGLSSAETSNDSPVVAPRVHALLVGADTCSDKKLVGSPGAGRDCADFESLLRDHFDIPASQITELTGEAVTTEAFTKALTKVMVEDARSGDTVIFYYSGLSIRVPDLDGDETGSGTDTAFITYDINPVDPKTRVSDDTLVSLLSKCKAANRLIVLDTCNAVGFADGFVELSPDKPKGGNSTAGDQPRTLFLAACGEDQVCLEVPGDRLPVPQKEARGIFTYYLTRALREVSPDIELTHVAAVVKSTVAAFTTVGGKTAQNPVLLGNVGLDEQIGTFFGKAPVR